MALIVSLQQLERRL